MPLAIVLLVIDVAFVVHAAKTGRFNPWGYLILLLPGVGVIAYVLVELVPEWMGSRQAVSDYFAGAEARVRWAMLLDALGRHGEAKTICTNLLTQMRRAPKYVRKAQAEWLAMAEKQARA